jgi:site-specific recombinase XerD
VALLVNRYLRRIGVTDRSGPHLLRHTFATHALRARPNLRVYVVSDFGTLRMLQSGVS